MPGYQSFALSLTGEATTAPRTAFTEAEVRKSATAPTFANVDCDKVFGLGADTVLANRIAVLNPIRYHALKREYMIKLGKIRRPDSDYDAPTE